MDLEAFRKRIRELYSPTGYSQKILAHELGLQPTALSNKLNGTGETSLKHTEVKQIIKILAKWEALTDQSEALELLEMMKLSQASFTPEEWNSAPLNKLEPKLVLAGHRFATPTSFQAASAQPAHFFGSPAQLFESQAKLPPNLPAYPTSFIGRKQSITHLLSLLRRADLRLVTITGIGGVGKTRLALQLANELRPDFENGVFFVSLAAVSDPRLVLSTIARSLGIGESRNQPVAQLLITHLHNKRLLLVLDNFEQVLPASQAIKELMAALPHLKLLITSRMLLHLYGEHEYSLPPLSMPEDALLKAQASPGELELLGAYEAINLFVHRARAANPAFKLYGDNAPVVAKICQRLDGLPLAIELAAARVKIMSPALILARLDKRLELLDRGPVDLPNRQQNLRALFDWSFDLLDRSEKQLLARLSIFAGGCELAAVEAVCLGDSHPEGSKAPSIRLVNKLSDLVDKSMLQINNNTGGEPRFSMLETLREYAQHKLGAAGEADLIAERHATYFLRLAEQANQALTGDNQKVWLDRLETEHDNLRLALDWTLVNLNHTQAERALSFVKNLWRFWQLHSHFKESQQIVTQVLSQTATYELDGKLRAEVLQGAGVLFSLSDYTRSSSFQQENLALRRTMQDEKGVVTALIDLGWSALHQADFEQAALFGEEGLKLARNLKDKSGTAAAIFVLSIIALYQADTTQAGLYAEECLHIWQELGDQGSIASGYLQLGMISLKKGEYKQARSQLLESLHIYLRLGNKIGIISVLGSLAELAMYHRSAYEGSRRAVIVLGAIQKLVSSLDLAMPPLPKSMYDSRLAILQGQLDEPDFTAAFAEGGKVTMEQVLALVELELDLNTELPPLPLPLNSNSNHHLNRPHQKPDLPSGLTPRETEVLKLVATGLTTFKIAEELMVSPLTIQAHLRSIYSKLEVTSRSAATRYAIENKLV